MPRGPKSRIEVDGKGLAIYQDRQAGMTLEALAGKYGYPLDMISRFLRKTDRNSQDTVELNKMDASAPGLAEAVTLRRALVEEEVLKRLREAAEGYANALAAGDREEARRWHGNLVRATDLAAKAIGLDKVQTQVGIQLNVVNERRERLRRILED